MYVPTYSTGSVHVYCKPYHRTVPCTHVYHIAKTSAHQRSCSLTHSEHDHSSHGTCQTAHWHRDTWINISCIHAHTGCWLTHCLVAFDWALRDSCGCVGRAPAAPPHRMRWPHTHPCTVGMSHDRMRARALIRSKLRRQSLTIQPSSCSVWSGALLTLA